MTSRPATLRRAGSLGLLTGVVWMTGLAFAAGSGAAELQADFHFNGTRTAPTGETIADNGPGNAFSQAFVDGAPTSRTVLDFASGSGLSLPSAGLTQSSSYSVVMLFRLDSAGPGRRKLLDFASGSSDAGLYLCDGTLLIELVAASPCSGGSAVASGEWAQVVFTRDALTHETQAYLGEDHAAAQDGLGVTALASELRFFQDDDQQPGGEQSGGSVARLRVYEGVLSADDVDALDRVDATPPAVTLNALPSATSDPMPSFSGSAASAAGDLPQVTIEVYAGSTATGTLVHTLSAPRTGGSWSVRASTPWSDGAYTAQAEQSDGAGNTALSDPVSFTVDTVQPDTTVVSGPSGPTNDATPEFAFSSSEAGTFLCRLYAAGNATPPAFNDCSSPRTVGPLADGSYVFDVVAVDVAANRDASAASRSFRVDTIPPRTDIVAGPGDTTAANTVFLFSADEPATFSCRLDNGAWHPCASPQPYSDLALGPHKFNVRAADHAGNDELSTATHTWQVLKPGLTIPAVTKQAVALVREILEMRRKLKSVRLRRVARRKSVTLNGFDALTAGTVDLRVQAVLGRRRGRPVRRVTFLLGKRAVPRAGRYRVKLKVTKQGLRLTRRERTLPVVLRLAFTDVAGRSLWATAKTTMKR